MLPTIHNPHDLREAVAVLRSMRKRALRLGDVPTARALLRSINRLDAMRRRAEEKRARK